jgi:hypothetical protein
MASISLADRLLFAQGDPGAGPIPALPGSAANAGIGIGHHADGGLDGGKQLGGLAGGFGNGAVLNGT